MNEWAIRDRWKEINGRCECNDLGHDHEGRCCRKLTFVKRGYKCTEGWDIRKEYGYKGIDKRVITGFKIVCMECLENTHKKGDVSAGNNQITKFFSKESIVEKAKDTEM